jgi:hypothetical protein
MRRSRFFDKKVTYFKVDSSSLNSLTFEYVDPNLKKLHILPVRRMIEYICLAEDTALLESNRSADQVWKQGRG